MIDGTPQTLTVLYSETSLSHDTGAGHPENARRMAAALDGVDRAGIRWDLASPGTIPDLRPALERVHDSGYIDRFAAAVSRSPALFESPDNPISGRSFDAALAAVAAGLAAAERITSEQARRAFVVARPPGHHAERNGAMGFCFFNTIAVIAESLLASGAASRIAIVDFDVHHGNGTQHHFWERPEVLFASIHQWPFYPGTGSAAERGGGAGEGATINLPMDAGAGDPAWLRAFEHGIAKPLDAFAPGIILVSAGFDAHVRDPLGGMRLTDHAYREMTSLLVDLAERHASGRIISLLEGGYDPEGIASSVAAHVSAMA